ncbi:MAG: AMP-binding protein, partial [Oscillospiraceae bacterium]|nr:AMP-binding protein [Oscillospiraceae bacterium]
SKVANVLSVGGIKKGDNVIVMLKRHIEYWYVVPALHKIGAVVVPVTHMLTPEDIKYRFESGDIKAIICTSEDAARKKVLDAVEISSVKPLLWTIENDAEGFANLSAALDAAPDTFPRIATKADEASIMYFTSGTTGYPKAVIHDHTYSLSHIITAKHWQNVEDGGLHFTVAETGWGKASWGKMYGQWLCGSCVMIYDFDNFDPKQLTNIMNRFGVNTFCAPATVYRYLVKKGMSNMPSLHYAVTAGESLSPDVSQKFTEITGIEISEGYGQTESTLMLANFVGMEPRKGTLGKPSPLYDVAIEKNDGTLAGDNEMGEIIVIPKKDEPQHGVFMAYYKDDALYDEVWRGGVYHTGDVGWRDEDGY